MLCYRLLLAEFDPLSAQGAIRKGGRFNSPGRALLYLATSEAIAILESRVHSRRLDHKPRLLHTIEVDDAEVSRPNDLGLVLPAGWDAIGPAPVACQFGVAWFDSGASLALLVPSVTALSREGNLLVNTAHPRFSVAVRLHGGVPFQFDHRLFRRKPGER